MPKSRTIPFLIFLLVTAGYQFFYCRFHTNGNPTGLFFFGSTARVPPELESRVYRYENSSGFDGQIYWVIAHDPFNRHGYWKYFGEPRYRTRKVLVPVLAGVLGELAGGGSAEAVDYWYIALTDLLLAAGAVCFIRLTEGYCGPLLAMILYWLIPSTIASTDRMVSDGPMVACLIAAWVFLREKRMASLVVALACAALARETGLMAIAGAVAVFAARREMKRALWAGMAAAPALMWWVFAATQTEPVKLTGHLSIPIVPHVARLFTPVTRPVEPQWNTLLQAVDAVSVACALVAMGMLAVIGVRQIRRRNVEEDVLFMAPMGVLVAFGGDAPTLFDPYSFMRVYGALLAWCAVRFLWMGRVRAASVYMLCCSSGLLMYRLSWLVRG